jgi:ABC-type hemin transport system substrate-binding protein
MANAATTKAARRAAREAAVAAQEELARRTRANMEDLAVVFSARERAEAVDEWLAQRVAALQAQAERRRDEHRTRCGIALRSMRDRGQSLAEIARMAGIGEKAARDLIRMAGPVSADGVALS